MAAQSGSFALFQAGVWLAVVLVAVGLAIVAVRILRQRLLLREDAQETGWTLDNLRRQRDQGLVTPGEYEAIRRQIVAQLGSRTRSTDRLSADKLVQGRRVS